MTFYAYTCPFTGLLERLDGVSECDLLIATRPQDMIEPPETVHYDAWHWFRVRVLGVVL